MFNAQLFLVSQSEYHTGNSKNDNLGNRSVTYLRCFMYEIIKLCVKVMVCDTGDNICVS